MSSPGELRGNAKEGYRGHFECPHCQKKVFLSAMADLVKRMFVLWPVNPSGEYTPADLAGLDHARVHGDKPVGVQMPTEFGPGRSRIKDDPIPAFGGGQGT
jgi:hypothetical protein